MPSAKAIAKGLAAGHTSEKPGYWVHVCGTGTLMHYDGSRSRYGEALAPGEIYHDIDDTERILSYPDEAMHRDVEKVVLGAAESSGGAVRTLIVSPPCIYGVGRGPANRRSIQVNRLAALTLQDPEGAAPVHGPGPALTEWDHVHVADLSAFFVLAAEAALDPALNADPRVFGPRAYYFLEAGKHTWREVAQWIAASAARLGYVPKGDEGTPRTREIDLKFFAMNARSVAARARKYLGWEPHAPGLKEEIDTIVRIEAEALGK